jgi:hypothetical protein
MSYRFSTRLGNSMLVAAFTTLIAGMPVKIASNGRINFYNFDRILFQPLSLKEREISNRDS